MKRKAAMAMESFMIQYVAVDFVLRLGYYDGVKGDSANVLVVVVVSFADAVKIHVE